MKRDECSEQEQWVLERLEQGEIADLKKQFGEAEEKRRLRAIFLEALLTDEIEEFKPRRQGIRITQAIMGEALNLENAEVVHIVGLDNFIFQEEVNFRDTRFHRYVFLNGSQFGKKADFHRMQVKLGLLCRKTVFRGPVDFGWTDIGGQFIATGAQFASQKHEANFNALKVGQSAFFDNAVFQGPVDFGGAGIGGQFIANGVQFASQKHKTNFNGLKVGQDAFFRGAVFRGSVNCSGMLVKEGLHLTPLEESDRTYLTIFHKGANFGGTEIRRQLGAHSLRFLSESEPADFNGLKVGQLAFFDNAVFQGPVAFVTAAIGGQLSAKGAKFLNPEKEVSFGYLKVGQSAFFDNAVFQGPLSFVSVDIGEHFSVKGAQFQSQETAMFVGLKVDKIAFFEGAEFAGPVALKDAHLSDLLMGGNPIPELDLERTRVERELKIGIIEKKTEKKKETEIGIVNARNLTVQGPTTLQNVTIKAEADFRDASFQQLNFTDVEWPVRKEGKARVWLDGIGFKALSTKKDPQEDENWNKILQWLSLARFNTQNYNRVDEYFQRCGLAPWAYKVFREGKKRGLSRRRWWEPGKYATRIFWGWLAGYGRKPARTLGLIIPLILIGAFLLEPQFAKDFSGTQSAFNAIVVDHDVFARCILSLDRFLPGVDLGLAKHWQPSHLGLWTWLYWYFLKIMGWITIPITLAAIYTKIK
jgi:hypothetical protein